MHSSGMRTGRSLTVCWSLLPGGGVCSRGIYSGGECLLLGGCLVLGSVCSGGVWSGGVSQHALRQTPPLWTDRCL